MSDAGPVPPRAADGTAGGPRRVYHLVGASDWAAALADGGYVPASLAAEGFVHLSYAHQVERVANARYRDRDDLVCVELDPDAFPVQLVEEDSYGAGETFPHLYAVLPTAAAVALRPVVRLPSGALAVRLD